MSVTDPKSADTDGDGLSDGEEAGEPNVNLGRGAVYALDSDPTRADSDGDVLDDATEVGGGFDVWAEDSRSDGLEDLAELEFGSDPLVPNAVATISTTARNWPAATIPTCTTCPRSRRAQRSQVGVVSIEWVTRKAGLSDEQVNSLPYLTGSLLGQQR